MTNQQEWFNIQKVINECVMDKSLFILGGGGGGINFKYLIISYYCGGIFVFFLAKMFGNFLDICLPSES